MEPISALAWVATVSAGVITTFGAHVVRRVTPEQALVESALRHATMADLQRRLAEDEGVVVRVTYVDSVLGPRLWLDAADLTVTMHLFRSLDPSWRRLEGSAAVLRTCQHQENSGWNLELDTLEGHRHTTGWRVEVAPRRAPAQRPAAVPPY